MYLVYVIYVIYVNILVDYYKLICFRLLYMIIFGGVLVMIKEQMLIVNGYFNKFFGWGGEDDEMYNR